MCVLWRELGRGRFGDLEDFWVEKGKREKGKREKGKREKGKREKGKREKGKREKGKREKGKREKGKREKGKRGKERGKRGLCWLICEIFLLLPFLFLYSFSFFLLLPPFLFIFHFPPACFRAGFGDCGVWTRKMYHVRPEAGGMGQKKYGRRARVSQHNVGGKGTIGFAGSFRSWENDLSLFPMF
jgi:hypothetical protein